ncbi:putative receptor like protein 25 [Quercus lobata]|uniref:putative receptor like protein 25 n=1 Tax=Quercus lobata TaxID=97700 RepID=UPI001243C0DE|nr:putative receptor like protein 25 [Quercus lobata]
MAKNLTKINLSYNDLIGGISSTNWIDLSNLFNLDLRSNSLDGNIPTTLKGPLLNVYSLSVPRLRSNQLEGELVVPPPFATYLDFSRNNFYSAIPASIGHSLPFAYFFSLSNNKFHWGIPLSLCGTTYIQILDLSYNTLNGTIPQCLIEMSNTLKGVGFEEKQRGSISDTFLDVCDVITVTSKVLDIELVKILIIVTLIDISCNNLDGPIPPSLGNLAQLESLDLSSNNLTGEIPMQLADLIFLAVLKLSFNQLVEQIPQGKQFATFSEDSYEWNKGLCGYPLEIECTSTEPRSLHPTFEETHSNSRIVIDWNFLSSELGFVVGLGILIGPLTFWKRWRIWYYKN